MAANKKITYIRNSERKNPTTLPELVIGLGAVAAK
jgi:hypothetical protein